MDEGGKALVGLVVACGDPAVLLEIAEPVPDQVAPSLQGEVARNRCLAVRPGRDHRASPALVEFSPQAVAVETLVADQGVKGDALDQGRHAEAVVALPGQQNKAHQVAEHVHQGNPLVVRPPRERPIA